MDINLNGTFTFVATYSRHEISEMSITSDLRYICTCMDSLILPPKVF
jgi:hypothetical protein